MKIRLAGALTLLALPLAGAYAAEPKQVLIIHSFGRDLEPYNAVGSTLSTELPQLLRHPVGFHDVSLNAGARGFPTSVRSSIKCEGRWFPHKEELDNAYMRALYGVGYDRAVKGMEWTKVPPGFAPSAAAER